MPKVTIVTRKAQDGLCPKGQRIYEYQAHNVWIVINVNRHYRICFVVFDIMLAGYHCWSLTTIVHLE